MSTRLDNRSAEFDAYVTTLLSDSVLDQLRSANDWSSLEEKLAKIYLAILRPFAKDCHIQREFGFDLPLTPELSGNGESVCLGAVNFRGLFRRNGRETLLEPCNGFFPKTNDLTRHRTLHEVYLLMVGK